MFNIARRWRILLANEIDLLKQTGHCIYNLTKREKSDERPYDTWLSIWVDYYIEIAGGSGHIL